MTIKEAKALQTGDKVKWSPSGAEGVVDSPLADGLYIRWPFAWEARFTRWEDVAPLQLLESD